MAPPDFNEDILGDILEGLSDEDFRKINELAESFTSKNNTNETKSDSDPENGFPFDPEMIFKLMSIFEKLNSNSNDPRCNLISALKPLLSPKRQQRADRALEMIKMLSLLSDMENLGL